MAIRARSPNRVFSFNSKHTVNLIAARPYFPPQCDCIERGYFRNHTPERAHISHPATVFRVAEPTERTTN